MIASASAVLFGCPRVASTGRAKALASDVGAGTGLEPRGLLITSNLRLSAVLTGPIASRAPITRERKPQSYQLSWRAGCAATPWSGGREGKRQRWASFSLHGPVAALCRSSRTGVLKRNEADVVARDPDR